MRPGSTNPPSTDLDKTRSARSTGSGRLGGSLFGNSSSVPPELQSLVQPQTNISHSESAARSLVNTANTEYTKLTDPAIPPPTPPVHAARLSSLLKNLASAEGAVNDSMKARQDLISGLEKLLETNRTQLAEEQNSAADFSSRRATIEARKKEIEDGIMRGLSAESFTAMAAGQQSGTTSSNGNSNAQNGGSPDVEGFTPPPPDVETFTPTGSPGQPSFPADEPTYPQDFLESSTFAADPIQEERPQHNEPPPAFEPPPALKPSNSNVSGSNGMPSGTDALLSSLALPHIRPASHTPPTNGASADPRLKRRKMSHKPADMDEEIFGGGEGVGIDQDVAAMLGAQ